MCQLRNDGYFVQGKMSFKFKDSDNPSHAETAILWEKSSQVSFMNGNAMAPFFAMASAVTV